MRKLLVLAVAFYYTKSSRQEIERNVDEFTNKGVIRRLTLLAL